MSSHPCDVTVTYPAGAKFDLDYYIKTHMPLVQEKWGPYGMTDYNVLKYKAAADGPAGFSYGATLRFKSVEDFEKSVAGPEAPVVLGDVPNFTDAKPTITYGERVTGN